jgi:hypothetical protein
MLNYALSHEGVWGSGCIDPRFLDVVTSWRWVSGQFHAPAGTHWIGGWVDPRAGLDDMEKWKFFTLPGLELRTHLDRGSPNNQSAPGTECQRSCVHPWELRGVGIAVSTPVRRSAPWSKLLSYLVTCICVVQIMGNGLWCVAAFWVTLCSTSRHLEGKNVIALL